MRQLPRPRSGHGIQSGLGTAVDTLRRETERSRDGGEVDDTTGAIGRKVLLRRADEEERTSDVDAVPS